MHRSGSRWRAERRGVWECRRFTEGSLAVDTARDKAADSWGWGTQATTASRGPSWWCRARTYRLCSGREEAGGWDSPQSWRIDTAAHRPIGGYKRRRGEALEEASECQGRCLIGFAGPSRANLAAEEQGEEGQKGGVHRSDYPQAGRTPRREKEEKEETEGSRQRRSPRRDVGYQARSRRRRWIRSKQLIQFLFKEPPKEEKGRQQRRLGAVLRGAASKESCKRAGLRDGNACPSRAATARPGRAAGRRRGGGRADEWDKNLNLLCPADPAFPFEQQPPGPRAVRARAVHRSSKSWTPSGVRGLVGKPLHSRPYGARRRQLASSQPTGDVSAGTCPVGYGVDSVAGATASDEVDSPGARRAKRAMPRRAKEEAKVEVLGKGLQHTRTR